MTGTKTSDPISPEPKNLSSKDQKKKGRLIWKGMIPDDDPRYQNAGWNFIMGKNVVPDPKKK
jgi:hypothetical protein